MQLINRCHLAMVALRDCQEVMVTRRHLLVRQDAGKTVEAVFLYVFRIAFTASLFRQSKYAKLKRPNGQNRVILLHHSILHLGHHPPWLGISSAITLGVLLTPSVLARKQSTKVNWRFVLGSSTYLYSQTVSARKLKFLKRVHLPPYFTYHV